MLNTSMSYATLFRAFEYLVLMLAIFMLSGGMGGVYTKMFNMDPPTSILVIQLPIMMAMAAVIAIRMRPTFLGTFTGLPFFLLGLLMAASVLWSDFPSVTLREGLMALLMVLYMGCAAWRYDWKVLIEAIWLPMFFMALLSLLLFVAVPSLGRMTDVHVGALSGVWIEKNAAGQAAVFGALLSLARMGIKPKTFITSSISFVLFVGILGLSTSKTALVSGVVGCGLFAWVFLIRRSPLIAILTVWGTVFIGAVGYVLIKNNPDVIFEALGRSSTLTGRTEIWKAVEVSLQNRPFLGHGYSAYWDGEHYLGRTLTYVFDELGYKPHHAHNSFIETRLNLGYAGVSLLISGLVLTIITSLVKLRANHGVYLAIPFILSFLIVAMFESSLAYTTNFAGAVMVLLCAKMLRPTQPSEDTLGQVRSEPTMFTSLTPPPFMPDPLSPEPLRRA